MSILREFEYVKSYTSKSYANNKKVNKGPKMDIYVDSIFIRLIFTEIRYYVLIHTYLLCIYFISVLNQF